MVWVHGGGCVDLEHVVVLSGVLKEAVHGVEHLVGEKEEPLAGRSSVVQPLLPTKHDVEPASQVLRLEPHYLEEGKGRGGGGRGEGRGRTI